ncbi:hypothetical protein OZN62_13605 [Aurantiacibacter sp. MUD11]|uniref:JAB domain-containing protein n=1 Tax=Aurantiacibacter sp. MUD11 TaxID=3003265 RepID=UPI0022AA0A17|nr:JAB domain-containing protein [Aurantiacibacter sp. MUD11]WAT17932.1 hypothetical protein OZN62_13605 [Aurantiacibacter sp. MUD11]
MGNKAHETSQLLFRRFGNISNILDATPQSLREALPGMPQVGDAITAASQLSRAGFSEALSNGQVSVEDQKFQDFLLATLQAEVSEKLLAIYLTQDGNQLAQDLASVGSRDSLAIRLRPLMERVFELKAAGFLLVHNHPSGNATPSDDDWDATHKLRSIAKALDCVLFDHLIVGRGAIYSMAKRQFLRR